MHHTKRNCIGLTAGLTAVLKIDSGISSEVVKKIAVLFSVILLLVLAGCFHGIAPVSDAGNNQQVLVGSTVELDGSDSYDRDGAIVEFKWQLTLVPVGSNASIDNADDEYATFIADVAGVYVAELVVFDGELYSGRDVVVVNAIHNNAGLPGTIPVPPINPVPPMIPPHSPLLPTPPPTSIPPAIISYIVQQNVAIQITPFTGGHGSIQEPQWEMMNSPEGAEYSFGSPFSSSTLFDADTVGEYQLLFTQRSAPNVGRRYGGAGIKVIVHVQENEFQLIPPPLMAIDKPIYIPLRATTEIIDAISDNGLPNDDVSFQWSIIHVEQDANANAGPFAKIIHSNILGVRVIVGSIGLYELSVKITSADDEYNVSFTLDINADALTIFDHSDITDECVICHNGVDALGRSINHLSTTDQCESCHSVEIMVPVYRVDHSQVLGSCEACHNGTIATGKGNNHVNTSNQCSACHSAEVMLPVITVDHNEVIGSCLNCHDGVLSVGLNADHIIIPATQQCDECHSTRVFSVSEEGAILLGLHDDNVNVWYESIGRSILCGTNESGLLKIDDYTATSIETFAPVPETDIHCSATLDETEHVWEIIYRDINGGIGSGIDSGGNTEPTTSETFIVKVDAIKGVIIP